MRNTKITAPVKGYSGKTAFGPHELDFTDGVAHTDNAAVIAYARRKGYGVSTSKPRQRNRPEPPDPRKIGVDGSGIEPVGTRLRDAAVDPAKGDFLPPTNAGQANPHGPLVVGPGIHAEGERQVRPGVVHVDDTAQQSKDETEHATKLLVEQAPVDAVVETAVPDRADHGPLDLSDPGSADAGKAAAKKATPSKRATKTATRKATKKAAKRTARKGRS